MTFSRAPYFHLVNFDFKTLCTSIIGEWWEQVCLTAAGSKVELDINPTHIQPWSLSCALLCSIAMNDAWITLHQAIVSLNLCLLSALFHNIFTKMETRQRRILMEDHSIATGTANILVQFWMYSLCSVWKQ